MEKSIKVDLVIPVYKPDRKFYQLMAKLAVQTYPLNQIIIINTEKAFFPEEAVRGFDNVTVKHISKSQFDHGGTRNLAASLSKSPIILFMTQDAVPEDEFLIARLTEPIRLQIAANQAPDEIIGISYARQLPDEDCGFIEAYTRSFNYPDKSRVKSERDLKELGIKTFFASNVCAAYRKDIYEEIGGFVTKTIFNEDMIFAGTAIKKGIAIAYQAEARVIHSHNYSNRQQLHRNFDLAVSQKEYPQVFGGIKSESEGIRLVKRTASYLIKAGKPYLIPQLILSSGFKYMGYRLGLCYEKLPRAMVIWLSMNKSYWRMTNHGDDK